MKLENEVISLDFAKQFLKLGFKQESLFYWDVLDENAYSIQYCVYSVPAGKRYSAFTVSELMEMIPQWIDTKKGEPYNNFNFHLDIRRIFLEGKLTRMYCVNYYCDTRGFDEKGNLLNTLNLFEHAIFDKNLADCLAQVLLYMIGNGFIKNDNYK